MIRVVARVHIDPRDKEDFVANTKDLVKLSRLESGCRFYNLMISKDSNVLAFLEEWESEADLKNHAETEHFKNGIAIIEKYAKKPLDIEVYYEL